MALLDFFKKEKVNHAPKTVQESIPYTNVFKNGTIETSPGHYTRAYRLEDINFKIAPDTEQVRIFQEYGNLLNSFPPSVNFQVVIQNHEADRRASLENIRFRMQKDGLNKYRQEMNGILLDKMLSGRNNIKQEKYIIVSVENEDLEQAMNELNNVERELSRSIRKISRDVKFEPLSIEERKHCLRSTTSMGTVFFITTLTRTRHRYSVMTISQKAGSRPRISSHRRAWILRHSISCWETLMAGRCTWKMFPTTFPQSSSRTFQIYPPIC